jgi:Icc-related predicted phosphoesterase
MRFVFLSDTHNYLNRIVVPDGDVLVIAGDVTGRGRDSEIHNFNKHVAKLPHPIKLYTPGNHDMFEDKISLVKQQLTSVITLIDEPYEIGGLKLWFSPYTPTFYNWGFMRDRGAQIKQHWDIIPSDIDILVTHGPPFGILDFTDIDQKPVGCEDLRAAVDRIEPRYHVFGHIHERYGRHDSKNTCFLNVSCCNLHYDPINPPVVVDIEPV